MKILVTGSSGGIGKAVVLKFLQAGHTVIGMDLLPAAVEHPCYRHEQRDICGDLPPIEGLDILVNNAGVQNDRDIEVNLQGTIHVTERYLHPGIKSVVFIASASASTGAEFPEYAASKGGMVAYMKNVALRLAPYGATANAVSPGGVITDMNRHILQDESLYRRVLEETLLHKWALPEEIAEFVYFLSVVNQSMTGEDLLIDNGEKIKSNFIW